MVEIKRQPMITEVHCRECRAELVINTDSQRLVEKSVTKFAKFHHCRAPEGEKSKC